MAFGLEVYNAAGAFAFGMTTIGNVFVEERTLTYGTSGVITYTAQNGLILRLFQLSKLTHTLVTGVDGSGNPTLTYTPFFTQYHIDSNFLVFAS